MATQTMRRPPAFDLMTIAEVAALVGVSTRSISNYVRDGKMPRPARLGCGLVRWNRDTLYNWLANALSE